MGSETCHPIPILFFFSLLLPTAECMCTYPCHRVALAFRLICAMFLTLGARAEGLRYSVCVCIRSSSTSSNICVHCPSPAPMASKSQLQGFQPINFATNILFKSYAVIPLFDGHWQSLWITDTKIGNTT